MVSDTDRWDAADAIVSTAYFGLRRAGERGDFEAADVAAKINGTATATIPIAITASIKVRPRCLRRGDGELILIRLMSVGRVP